MNAKNDQAARADSRSRRQDGTTFSNGLYACSRMLRSTRFSSRIADG